MTMKRTTLKDVAKAAGVSAMSVSKALNNKGGISPKTKKHIFETAHNLGYRPNMVAKNLRLDETDTLGVVVSDSSEMVIAKVLRGIADCAQTEGYSILTINTDSDSLRERRAMELFINKCVDGIIMIAPTLDICEDTNWLNSLHTPIVALMRDSMHLSIDSVVNNNLRGGYDVVEHLISRGCRSFRFLSLTNVSQIGATRLEGARMALEKHKLALNPSHIRYCRPQIQAAESTMNSWIKEKGTDFDALICGCDIIAIGAIDALLNAGVQIPQQMCISGYDDIELAGYLRIPLTTIRQPLYEIGQKGVKILLERIHHPDLPAQRVVFDSILVERESSNR